MHDKSEIRVTRGELYALVLQTFLFIAAGVAALLTFAPGLRDHVRTPAGVAAGTLVIALIVLPMQRVLVRTYYGREMPVAGSIVSAFAATTLVFGVYWFLQKTL